MEPGHSWSGFLSFSPALLSFPQPLCRKGTDGRAALQGLRCACTFPRKNLHPTFQLPPLRGDVIGVVFFARKTLPAVPAIIVGCLAKDGGSVRSSFPWLTDLQPHPTVGFTFRFIAVDNPAGGTGVGGFLFDRQSVRTTLFFSGNAASMDCILSDGRNRLYRPACAWNPGPFPCFAGNGQMNGCITTTFFHHCLGTRRW
ncbi:hypothetical protein [Parapedobacter sp. 2B3]|uniref:hypothetical protein n=1 Tax=Parapedobacter sp. 2B3 TaxID=3342381 RepID=UPI0035B59364